LTPGGPTPIDGGPRPSDTSQIPLLFGALPLPVAPLAPKGSAESELDCERQMEYIHFAS